MILKPCGRLDGPCIAREIMPALSWYGAISNDAFPTLRCLPKILYWRARVAQHTNQSDMAIRLYQRILDDYPAQYHSVQARAQLHSLGAALHDGPDPLLPVVPFETFALPPEAKKATPPEA